MFRLSLLLSTAPVLTPARTPTPDLVAALRQLAERTTVATYLRRFRGDAGGDAFINWFSMYVRPGEYVPASLRDEPPITRSWPTLELDELAWYLSANCVIAVPKYADHVFIIPAGDCSLAPAVTLPERNAEGA